MGAGASQVPYWTGPDDLVARLRRRWEAGEFLTALGRGAPWEPVAVPLRAPTAAELADHFGAAQDWIGRWRNVDADLVRLEQRTVGGRLIGANRVPARAVIDTPRQLWALLRVGAYVATYERLLEDTQASAPALLDWMVAHPIQVLRHADRWSRLVDTVLWIDRNGRPETYLRHVDVPGVDTKFIEQYRAVLAGLLDHQLEPGRIDQAHPPSRFTRRYGFRTKPVYVRLRSLGRKPPTLGPYQEVTVRVEELAATPVEVSRVIVVENEITYLALPPVDDAVAVLGGGYALSGLALLNWLHSRELVYWGDVDTHGFAILDRLRQIFPHTRSILMDRDTLLTHRAHWGREPSPIRTGLPHLHPAEADLYADLLADRYAPALRLEQERIRFGIVERALRQPDTSGG
ncbi:Wadjet anti-phage system protein JetD domain-containing protein [Polymorphospora lycopeni]|uniref:Wadjet anti-phage system protein JetD domain-containing protein n=1 Tax=Polymorphospora lycopeni TaxID=3140240 RepID=A0ABV5CX71_9ACTN